MKFYNILLLILLLILGCTNRIKIIEFNPKWIEIQEINFQGCIWSTVMNIKDEKKIKQIVMELNDSEYLKKDKFTKYPPANFILKFEDSLTIYVLPDRQTFNINDKYYKSKIPISILLSITNK